jgi:hypothetical protein
MDSVAGSEAGRMALAQTGREKGAEVVGGLRAFPAGALEITDNATRFVPFTDLRRRAAAFTAGAVLGTLILARRRKI